MRSPKEQVKTKGIMSTLMGFDLNLDGKVCTDASAAIGISYRRRSELVFDQLLARISGRTQSQW